MAEICESPQQLDPQQDLEKLASECKDYSGELLRRQALRSSGGFLWTWNKEWCLLTHNFLIFFASRTDLAVKHCLLLASMQDVKQEGNTLHLVVEGKEELLRSPEKQSMKVWCGEIRQRLEKLREGGQMITPCLSFAEAKHWAQEALAELSAEGQHQEAEQQRQKRQYQALALMLQATLSARIRSVQRRAFTELGLHARIQGLCQAQRNAAACRLWRAIKRPCWHQWERTFNTWRSQGIPPGTRKMRLALALSKLGTEAEALQFGLLQLSRHRRAEQRKEQAAALEQNSADAFYKGLLESKPAARHRSGAQLLRLALMKCSLVRKAAALSTWTHFSALRLGADVQQLQQQTKSVNAELAAYKRRIEVEGRIKCFVFSLSTAVQRRQIMAFNKLGTSPSLVPQGGQGGSQRLHFHPAARS